MSLIGASSGCRSSGPKKTMTPSIACWKRRSVSRRSALLPSVGYPNHWHFVLWPQNDGDLQRAEDWRWGSLHQRAGEVRGPLLSDWPLPEPRDWLEQVNLPQTEAELHAIRRCLRRGSPYGSSGWIERAAEQLGL